MISLVRTREPLSPNERMCRAGCVAGLTSAAMLLRAIDPAHVAFGISCRAITGVPCIFCGLTRALHYLFRGDVSRALYFNWLAVPLLAMLIAVVTVAACEWMSGRRFIRMKPVLVTRREIALTCCALLAVWCFQVWLAIVNHKTELLNPAGPLYALLVR